MRDLAPAATLAVVLHLALACAGTTEPAAPTDVRPSPGDRTAPVRSLLDTADAAYLAGEYAAATSAYDVVLGTEGPIPAADRVLFRLGILHLLPDAPEQEPAEGRALLSRLLEEHPASRYAPAARVMLRLSSRVEELDAQGRRLEAEVQRLESQLEALKRIDLDRDRDQQPP